MTWDREDLLCVPYEVLHYLECCSLYSRQHPTFNVKTVLSQYCTPAWVWLFVILIHIELVHSWGPHPYIEESACGLVPAHT